MLGAHRAAAPPDRASRSACAGSWVTTTIETLEPGERPLHRVARRLVERGRRLVEQQHLRLEREGARQHHALLLADREPRGLALRVVGGEPRERQAALHVGVAPAEARAVAHVVGHACPGTAPAAGARGRPGGAARAGRARARRRPSKRTSPSSGSASRLSRRSRVDLPLPDGPRIAVAPGSRRRSRPRSTGRPSREADTSRSSKSGLRPRRARSAGDRADSAPPAPASVRRAPPAWRPRSRR